MSYKEYLRRKAAAEITILDTRENTDASMHTTKVRMSASTIFPTTGGQVGVVNTPYDSNMAPLHKVMSYQKKTGGSVMDASTFAAFRGSQAIGGYEQAGIKPNTISIAPCCVNIVPTAAPQSASDFTRRTQGCKVSLGQKHTAATVTPPVFVDDTIRNLGNPAICTPPPANHTASAEVPHLLYSARPSVAGGQYADKGNLEPGKELGSLGGTLHYKAGGALRKIPYVEKHHGNDLNVNPARNIMPFVPSASAPGHLKINEPIRFRAAQ
jgi:hypothetical protein